MQRSSPLSRAAVPALALALTLGGCAEPGRPAGAVASAPPIAAAAAPAAVHTAAEDARWLDRLSWGASASDLAQVRRQGREAWLEQQLRPGISPLPAAAQAQVAALGLNQQDLGAQLREIEVQRKAAEAQATDDAAKQAAQQAYQQAMSRMARAATARSLLEALYSPQQLREQMTWFWFNHFNVHQYKSNLRAMVGDYEQGLREHALGRFRDLLGFTAHHPAMLRYLDNEQNAAQRINENYARELMELHTLGVDGGYSQRDVTELARMLTGWGLDARQIDRGERGDGFRFEPRRHDGGVKTWLGRHITPAGQAEGELALDVLASHPATARHLAYKFAQAFVADQPPPALVDRLANSFLASGGDLRALTRTLLLADEFWSREAYQAKFKTPWQYLLSSLRALDLPVQDPQPLLAALAQAGQRLYGAATPDGYKNVAAAWRNPEALTQRVQLASALGARSGVSAERLGHTLGGLLGPPTRRALAEQPPAQQLALLLSSPDFMKH